MKFFITIILFFFTVISFKNTKSQEKLENEILSISVNGLVCDFCARSIEKLFNKKESVKIINVNLEKMLITITLKKGKSLNDSIIKKVISDSGYEIREISRDK
tara:strand:+ start:240 stop:548 length:309 start_codon:yes stop_codon:yes gene_type:complete